jgi:hypothetical protein
VVDVVVSVVDVVVSGVDVVVSVVDVVVSMVDVVVSVVDVVVFGVDVVVSVVDVVVSVVDVVVSVVDVVVFGVDVVVSVVDDGLVTGVKETVDVNVTVDNVASDDVAVELASATGVCVMFNAAHVSDPHAGIHTPVSVSHLYSTVASV